jgi:PKD repeat protein
LDAIYQVKAYVQVVFYMSYFQINHTMKQRKIFLLASLLHLFHMSIAHIDSRPTITWQTMFGSGTNAIAKQITVDQYGCIYITGYTSSSTGIAQGGFQTTFGGTQDAFVAKLNQAGQVIWSTYFGGANQDAGGGIAVDPLGNVYVAGYTASINNMTTAGAYNTTSGGSFLLKLNVNGQRVWSTYTNCGGYEANVAVDSKGNIYVAGQCTNSGAGVATAGAHQTTNNGGTEGGLMKFSPTGQRLWGTLYGGSAGESLFAVAVDGRDNIYIAGSTNSNNVFGAFTNIIASNGAYQTVRNGNLEGFIAKFDSAGVRNWGTYVSTSRDDEFRDMVVDADGNVYLTGYCVATFVDNTYQFISTKYGAFSVPNITNSSKNNILMKFNTLGNREWGTFLGGEWDDVGNGIALDPIGGIYITGTTASASGMVFNPFMVSTLAASGNGYASRFDQNGRWVWGTYLDSLSAGGLSAAFDKLGSLIICATSQSNKNRISKIKIYDAEGYIQGRVFGDINSNCTADTADVGLKHYILKAEPGSYYSCTDSVGNFSFSVASKGNYVIKPITTNTLWTKSCVDSLGITVDSVYNRIDSAYLPYTAAYYAPKLNVDLGSPIRLRKCTSAQYTVSYCNEGTLPANNSYVLIEPGQYLKITGCSLPIDSVSPDSSVYRIPVGNLGLTDCGEFYLNVFVQCNAPFGGTNCIRATMFPDIPYANPEPDSAFDNRQVSVRGRCRGADSVEFVIQNNHPQGYVLSGGYKIYVNTVLNQEHPFSLGYHDSLSVWTSSPGNTIRNELGFVVNGMPKAGMQATLEGCNNQIVSGFVTQLPENDNAENTELDCQGIFASYDPNDKRVSPTGVTGAHYISSNSELEYTLRFQNTGNDTAFTVTLIDTLSPYLNAGSLHLGASSHAYVFNLSSLGIASWTFDKILLPDSSTSEPESHGFVKFKVQQKENNSQGTVIQNFVDIYFDYNLPVRTNSTINVVYDTTLSCSLANASFSSAPDSTNPLQLAFYSFSANDTSVSYLWDFGDDSTSVLQNPTHIFQNPGNYDVCVTTTNSCGQASVCNTVSIQITGISLQYFDSPRSTIYPNPFEQQTTLEYSLPQNCALVKINLYDVNGKLISIGSPKSLVAGDYKETVRTPGPGFYMLEFIADGAIHKHRITSLR